MNKLQRELINLIDNKRDKFIKRFELFNNNEEYWNEGIEEDIIRNLTYSENCNEWLDAITFYGYDIMPFPKKFLIHKFDDIFDEDKITVEHADIIHEYFINRFIVSLIVENKIDKNHLHSSLKFYKIYTKKRGYKIEKNIFNDKEMSMSYILCNIVPSGVVRHLLGINFEEVSSKMNPDVRTFDMIWSYAWRLLYRLNTNKLNNIDKHWKNLIVSWKKCFISYEFHGFKPSFFVLLYFAYCQAQDKQFKIENLIHQIIN